MAQVTLKNLEKSYGPTKVIHGIDLEIKDKEFVVFVGPSGCGKSTTLRMIAGLETISGGELVIGDRVVNDMPPRQRNISMVFQDYALYPHMTVAKNLGFSLKIAGVSQSEIEKRVADAAGILGLEPYLKRKPGQLSGGQRQRVAMGRAIVRHPDVYLFDEPLSNLDAKLRTQMRIEIKKLHQRVGNTIIYVTHDQVEAMTLADRIVIMRDGIIEQVGSPREVFEKPNNTFVATFIGSPPMNLIDAHVASSNGDPVLKLGDGSELSAPARLRNTLEAGKAVKLGVRPEDISPEGNALPTAGEIAQLQLPVLLSEDLGSEATLFTELAGSPVQSIMYNPRTVHAGETLSFNMALDKCHVFDGETLRNLAA
ncbi:sugar ABC transporter, ATP-binding protein (plasmid) [Pseudovibrio sp. FO-BEG1]|uniref:ABC transporter ATP-binding protein n=1 Tax=Pseudovibrio sp. (strain FO-BEG1) TaxID=911045 RepID=UPI000238CD6B|nr:sn-glycerol-3-phosphate ABC transporter ATP-binding protein UgpC [Pseudovibrio sp. FO-BEG1]AEV39788.1 sugar ABC transporter, ATP-binding protein [Pseudovibrio sp. FO-BEG1]